MGHIQHRGKNRWRARYIGPDGRERSKTFARKVDAEQFLATVQADMLRGQWVDPRRSRQTVGEWAEEFQRLRTRKRPSTREREQSALRTHILPFFVQRGIGTITRIDVQAWVDEPVLKGLAPSTVRREYGVLHKLFEEAVDADWLMRNPCRQIVLPEDDDEEEQRFLTAHEVEALYEAMHARYRAMILVGSYAGLRIGEMAGLKEHRILFVRRQVDVQEGLFEPERGPVVIGKLKTKYSRGRVDVPEFLMTELAEHLRRYPRGEHGLVFTSPQGMPLRPRQWRRRFWHPAVEKTGLEACTPHALRHTFVSFLIDQGVPVEKVCQQARHRDPGFTWRVYRHRFDEASSEVAEALERARTASTRPAASGEVAELAPRDPLGDPRKGL